MRKKVLLVQANIPMLVKLIPGAPCMAPDWGRGAVSFKQFRYKLRFWNASNIPTKLSFSCFGDTSWTEQERNGVKFNNIMKPFTKNLMTNTSKL